jgi:hypothetical protein
VLLDKLKIYTINEKNHHSVVELVVIMVGSIAVEESILNMIIRVADNSPLLHQKRNEIAGRYRVTIAAVLKPIEGGVYRDTGTEITSGSSLEVSGQKEAVLALYRAARGQV